jgi:hypothetical protein
VQNFFAVHIRAIRFAILCERDARREFFARAPAEKQNATRARNPYFIVTFLIL